MKKFAAIFISVMLIALMAIAPVVSATAAQDFADAITANGKNTGTLTLNKYQVVPGGTGTEPVEGATFTAYRVYDLSDAGLFTVNANFAAVDKLADYVSADSTLAYNSTADLEALIPTLQKTVARGKLTAAKDGVYDSTDASGKYTFGDLPLGIYLVVETAVPEDYAVSSVPFLVSIPEWNEAEGDWDFDIEAAPKDDQIGLDKVITNSDDVDPVKDVKSATKDIGDKVEYKVTADIPYYGELTKTQQKAIVYTFVDTMSEGLTYNNDFVAKVGDEVIDAKYYTITVTGTTTVTVKFDFRGLNQYQGQDITITYSATINEKAVAGTANENAAKIRYTNNARPNNTGAGEPKDPDDPDGPTNPTVPSDPDDPDNPDDPSNPSDPSDPDDTPLPDPEDDTEETPESETFVYTYELDLTKTFNGKSATDAGANATGVEFTLTVKGGDKIKFIKEGDGVYRVCGDNVDAETAKTAVDTVSPKADGSLVLRGLDDVTYVLSETSSINGWSKLASDIEIALVGDKTDGEFNGKLASATATPGGDLAINGASASKTDGHFDITVNNVQNQFNLPLTGGAGLLLFTIGGGIVIAGAIIFFASMRKKNAAK